MESPSGYLETDVDVRGVVKTGRSTTMTFAYDHVYQDDVPRWDQVAQRGYSRYAFDPQLRSLLSAQWQVFPEAGPVARVDTTVSWHRTRERRERQTRGSSVLITEQDIVGTLGASLDVELRRVASWTFSAGLEAYREGIGSWRRDENQSSGLVSEKRGLYPDGASASSFAGFVNASWSLRRLQLDLGGRYSSYGVSASDATFGELDLSPSALVGSVAARYELSPGLELVGSVAQSFRAPNVDDVSTLGAFDFGIEVPSPGLSPERGLGFEAGVRARAGGAGVSVIAFQTNLRDLIERVPSSFGGSETMDGQRVYQKTNVARAFVRGTELEAEVRISASLRAAAHVSYAYGHQPSVDQPMRRIPPLNGMASLRWSGLHGTWVEGRLRAAGAQRRLAPGDVADHRIPAGGKPGWQVFDIYAGHAFGPRFSVTLGLVNLLDEAYRVHGSGIDGYGRSGWVATRVGF
ncbi:MAG: TonB-dependent receptor [Acidobacteria bacterium]|nr:MAG: TonB-dependent receptor [Acidobacteriota bacterium]